MASVFKISFLRLNITSIAQHFSIVEVLQRLSKLLERLQWAEPAYI